MHPLAELHATPQWVLVKLVPKPDGKTHKYPLDHRSGAAMPKGSGGALSPHYWASYAQARAAAARYGPGHSVGFVLTEGSGWFCLDIDNALQADGTWSALAHTFIQSLPGTVVEVSQSGRGLHIWGRGKLPPHGKHPTGLNAELYTADRFIVEGSGAVGTLAPDCPSIVAVAAAFFPFRAAGSGAELPATGPRADWQGPANDDELIEHARRQRPNEWQVFDNRPTFADLFDFNEPKLRAAYRDDSPDGWDRSTADAALARELAYLTGCDADRMERIMRKSKLARARWDEHPAKLRGKSWSAIDWACATQERVYTGGARTPASAPPADPAAAPAKHYALLPDTPLETARAFIDVEFQGRALKAWQGQFYRWRRGAWQETQGDDIRAAVYAFIDRARISYFSPTAPRVTQVVDALKSAAHLDSATTPPSWINGATGAPPDELLLLPNGMLKLSTGELLPATPDLFAFNALPVEFDPAAPPPAAWLQFLAQVWPDDVEARSVLQELFGYLLTPDTRQQKLFLIVGPMRSGKGTIARVLTALLGRENVASPTLGSMAESFGLAPLMGKLAAVISDARLGGRADQKDVAENLLRISGEDQVSVNRKFLPAVSLRLGVRFVLLSNEIPKIADASGAMASRFVILKMEQSFYGREDPGLTHRLMAELPGILLWAVEGWRRLHARGYFIEPKSSADAAQEMADLASPIGAFIRDRCVVGPAHVVGVKDLFLAWQTWCAEQGIQRPGNIAIFGRDLKAALPAVKSRRGRQGHTRVNEYAGVALVRGGQGDHTLNPLNSYALPEIGKTPDHPRPP